MLMAICLGTRLPLLTCRISPEKLSSFHFLNVIAILWLVSTLQITGTLSLLISQTFAQKSKRIKVKRVRKPVIIIEVIV